MKGGVHLTKARKPYPIFWLGENHLAQIATNR